MNVKMEQRTPKVEVQEVQDMYKTVVQQDTPTSSQENGLDEFLTFDTHKTNGAQQATAETMETEEAEENVDVVFEVNGQKINTCMSASMAMMLKESEEMRLQVIDKIMAEARNQEQQELRATSRQVTDPSSAEMAASKPGTDSSSSNNIFPQIKTENIEKPQLNGQTTIPRKAVTTVVGDKTNNLIARHRSPVIQHKVVTKGSIGIVKPKVMGKPQYNPIAPTQKVGVFVKKPFVWDHPAIVALIECYKGVNDRLRALHASNSIDMWPIVGKRMRARCYDVSDAECEKKFATLTTSYRSKKQDALAGRNSWEYYKMMENALSEGTFSVKPDSKVASKPVPVIDVDDESPSASEDEDMDDDGNKHDPTSPPNTQETAIDKFRKTYLRVETAKLRELKATRELQQEQCNLQRERNRILSSIAELLGPKK